jgi:hypothetical protein
MTILWNIGDLLYGELCSDFESKKKKLSYKVGSEELFCNNTTLKSL